MKTSDKLLLGLFSTILIGMTVGNILLKNDTSINNKIMEKTINNVSSDSTKTITKSIKIQL